MQGMQGRYHVALQTITAGRAHVCWRSLSRRDARYPDPHTNVVL